MKYILSEKEYNELRTAKKARIKIADEKLQKLCTRIANEMPVHWGWNGPDPKPWGCFITADEQGLEWYCDKCPVQELCPYEHKEYSK